MSNENLIFLNLKFIFKHEQIHTIDWDFFLHTYLLIKKNKKKKN